MKGIVAIVAGAVLAAGITLSGSTVFAKPKCPKECKQEFVKNDKSCKADCKGTTPKSAKKACRKACATALKDERTKCKAATDPVFPSCSPSGAFVD